MTRRAAFRVLVRDARPGAAPREVASLLLASAEARGGQEWAAVWRGWDAGA
jgi:hypothetical protein